MLLTNPKYNAVLDMYVERNYLFSNIYKNLQQYCRLQHDVEFQVLYYISLMSNTQSMTHHPSSIILAIVKT